MTSSASITAQRAITAGYSDSYYGTGTVAMVLSKNSESIDSWEKINSSDIKVAVTPSDAEDLDALANKLEAPVLEDQSSEKLTQELFIPGKESKTFDTEHTWCDEFAQILIIDF